MSYEPKLIIRYSDLDAHGNSIQKKYWELIPSDNYDKCRVYKFLSEILSYKPVVFPEMSFVICQPEFTTFNALVRKELSELGIDYKTDEN